MDNIITRVTFCKGASAFLVSVVLIVFASGCATATVDHNWPAWGGPHGDFTVNAPRLSNGWPADGPPKIWSRALGAGYATIVCEDNTLYTMYRDGDNDTVIALDPDTGNTIWDYSYESKPYEGVKLRLEFGTGPNATPLILDDRLVTISFSARMHCLDRATGKLLWSHDLVHEFGGKVQEFGYATSPILHDGNIIALVGGEQHGVMAFNPDDGSVVWASGPHDISYSTPLVIDVQGLQQIVFFTSEEVVGIAADDGRFLWRSPCVNEYKNNAAPLIYKQDDRLLWVTTQMDGGTRVLRLTREGDGVSTEQVWFNDKIKIFHWNAVRRGDTVFASIGSQVTFLSAIDIRTGEILWRERGFHKANGLLADGKWIFLDENGTLAMARPTRDGLDLRASTPLTSKVSWTAPTLVGTTLYVRDKEQIIALDLR